MSTHQVFRGRKVVVGRHKKWLAGFVAAIGVLGATPLQANDGHGISMRLGVGDDYKRIEAAWNSPTLWSTQLFNRKLDLNAEASVAYWHADGGKAGSSVWQVTATPMLRYWFTERWYMEGGIGPSMFVSVKFADLDLGSNFQFADQIGVGVKLSDKHRVSLRYSHYSNAGFKKPNPGLDLIQLNYTYLF